MRECTVNVIHQPCPQAPGLVTETLLEYVWSSVTQVKASERGYVCANTVHNIDCTKVFVYRLSSQSDHEVPHFAQRSQEEGELT